MMIVGIYATLRVFLILAVRNPLAHLSFIWFTVSSSVVHGGIMALQSFERPENQCHLLGDIRALLIVAIVLRVITRPEGTRANTSTRCRGLKKKRSRGQFCGSMTSRCPYSKERLRSRKSWNFPKPIRAEFD